MHRVRIGYVKFLNTLPLVEGLAAWRDADLQAAVPSKLAAMLLGHPPATPPASNPAPPPTPPRSISPSPASSMPPRPAEPPAANPASPCSPAA